MLPDYTYYVDTYHGNQIIEADFPRLISRASAYLSGNCNIEIIPEEDLKKGLCAVAEAWLINEQGGDVISQSVGSWSKSYAQKKIKTDEQRLNDAAKLYIGKYCSLSVRWL